MTSGGQGVGEASAARHQALAGHSDRAFYIFNAVLTAAVLALLTYLLTRHQGQAHRDLSFLPAVNASLNATSALLLCVGYYFIRRGDRIRHQYCMVSAFAASALFFICYVIYHYAHGETKFQGTGPIRIAYFFILITHVLLAMAVLPLSLTTLYLAASNAFTRHRWIARIAFPIWLYVSITGVVVFIFLRRSRG